MPENRKHAMGPGEIVFARNATKKFRINREYRVWTFDALNVGLKC